MATTRIRAVPAGRERAWDLHPRHPAVLMTITTAALLLLGLMMILSASSVRSFAAHGSSFLYFNKQLMWAGIGVVAFILFARMDYRRLKNSGYLLYIVSVVLLAAVLIPGVGIVAGGSARWLQLGPLSFQPSEPAKLALVLLAAGVFARKDERSFQAPAHTMLPMVPALLVLSVLVLAQPDLGTTLVFVLIAIGMLFVAGAPLRHLVPIGAVGAAAATVVAYIEPYRRERLFAFMDPWADPLNTGYQTIQSLIALGSGGWFGVGLGASRQKWSYVPNAHTDFIFSILGEEMGLIGTLTVVGMFTFLTYAGIQTARRAPDRFGLLLASGITMWLAVQALINMGAVTASLPITGVPLPLVSFGGTSLVVSLAAMGILVSIACRSEAAATGRPGERRVGRDQRRVRSPRVAAR